MKLLARLWAAIRPDHSCRNACGAQAGPDALLCPDCQAAELTRVGLHPITVQGGHPQ